MEIVNLGQFRRFSRERPNRLGVFDRPRAVCDVLCLEPGQEERRRRNSASDEIYLVIEGQAYLRTEAQSSDLEELDMVLVPPGIEHWIANRGGGRLTVVALVAPKPGRASEVRMPAVRGGPRGRREFDAATERGEEPSRERDDRGPRTERPRAGVGRGPFQRGGRPPARGPGGGPPRGRPRADRDSEAGGERPARRGSAPGARGGRPPAGGRSGYGQREGGPGGDTRRGGAPRPAGRGRPPAGGGRAGPRGGGGGTRDASPRRSGPATRNERPAPGRNAPRTSRRPRAP